jgi:preprotein translocase subunit Sec63
VPSPWREHELILEILNSYERKHGDTMYALSYHWWDYWKEYTEKHASTAEVELFLDRMRDSVSKHPTMPESLKALMLDDKGKV